MGVWIETGRSSQISFTAYVTPCVGVWIETSIGDYFLVHIPSHPAWVCGLKLIPSGKYMTDKLSHPAWVCGLKLINIHITMSVHLSHPAWVCGLKLHRIGNPYLFLLSHPAWVCGLKLYNRFHECSAFWVTPCVGVWIETYSEHIANVQKGHTLRGCVD